MAPAAPKSESAGASFTFCHSLSLIITICAARTTLITLPHPHSTLLNCAHSAAYEGATTQQRLLCCFCCDEMAGSFCVRCEGYYDVQQRLSSGPHGVGQSGTCLAILPHVCRPPPARRVPVVYLTRTESWIQAAQRDNGDAFPLSVLWTQSSTRPSSPLRSPCAVCLQVRCETARARSRIR